MLKLHCWFCTFSWYLLKLGVWGFYKFSLYSRKRVLFFSFFSYLDLICIFYTSFTFYVKLILTKYCLQFYWSYEYGLLGLFSNSFMDYQALIFVCGSCFRFGGLFLSVGFLYDVMVLECYTIIEVIFYDALFFFFFFSLFQLISFSFYW